MTRNDRAVISDCGLYRYELRRPWGAEDGRLVCWIMLNPSTADADVDVDDPTIRRCISFSNRWGFDRLVAVNLFAFRATNPRALVDAPPAGVDPIGSANDAAILAAALEAEQVIAAWGTHGHLGARAAKVTQLLASAGADVRLHCLAKTKDGHPKHPLYVRGDTRPEVYRDAV